MQRVEDAVGVPTFRRKAAGELPNSLGSFTGHVSRLSAEGNG